MSTSTLGLRVYDESEPFKETAALELINREHAKASGKTRRVGRFRLRSGRTEGGKALPFSSIPTSKSNQLQLYCQASNLFVWGVPNTTQQEIQFLVFESEPSNILPPSKSPDWHRWGELGPDSSEDQSLSDRVLLSRVCSHGRQLQPHNNNARTQKQWLRLVWSKSRKVRSGKRQE